MSKLTVAAAQYGIGQPRSWEEYAARISRMVEETGESDLLLFPEYFSMELVSLFDEAVQKDLRRQLIEIQHLHDPFCDLFQKLSSDTGKIIQAGTFPVLCADGNYRNRAYIFTPHGKRQFQEKMCMTRFETELWKISSGREIKVFDTDVGKIGIAICYDAEFPVLVRRMVNLGADIILVPSCTDTVAGYNRVKIGCSARALENQCYVIQSPTVGDAPWSPAVDINTGAAAIFTPVDRGFPGDGILVRGKLNQTGWITGELDMAAIKEVRVSGQVLNHRDWRDDFSIHQSDR